MMGGGRVKFKQIDLLMRCWLGHVLEECVFNYRARQEIVSFACGPNQITICNHIVTSRPQAISDLRLSSDTRQYFLIL